MGLEWRRLGSRLTNPPTSPWTVAKLVKVRMRAGGIMCVSKKTAKSCLFLKSVARVIDLKFVWGSRIASPPFLKAGVYLCR